MVIEWGHHGVFDWIFEILVTIVSAPSSAWQYINGDRACLQRASQFHSHAAQAFGYTLCLPGGELSWGAWALLEEPLENHSEFMAN